jgi:hypothetical protein
MTGKLAYLSLLACICAISAVGTMGKTECPTIPVSEGGGEGGEPMVVTFSYANLEEAITTTR